MPASRAGSKRAIFRQVCELIPPHLVPKLARKHRIKSRGITPWSHLVSMLYAQFTHAIGLNDVVDALRAHRAPMASIRGAKPPSRNGLSHANRTRDPKMAEELFWSVLEYFERLRPGFGGVKFRRLRAPAAARRWRRFRGPTARRSYRLRGRCRFARPLRGRDGRRNRCRRRRPAGASHSSRPSADMRSVRSMISCDVRGSTLIGNRFSGDRGTRPKRSFWRAVSWR
ncbi:hypothetical protein L21SP4_00927 [Kiritimatiella glycovorans]|uniref:DUF4372 domain-containing protein n=1 Tax=Kiritimatiella glycovorans TaxID=1307763 RepID=A0A0G3EJ26_9BACT|nr:hypothetical protein L21SP4_00927 [Kiritimatiella glycovorans]